MSELKKVGQIQLEQDLRFQSREWFLQRIGRGVMLALALAALAGVFGKGPIARSMRQAPGGELSLQYDRVARHGAPTRLEVSLPRHSGETGVWLSQDFLDGLQLNEVVPRPARSTVANGRTIYFFDVLAPATITFLIQPGAMFTRRGQIGLLGGPELRFTQFVLP
ncbi:MAG TPA: hypothetical protein VK864_21090 [Longimicrobiales bacterium]|nr:hypothetical protein [Longimicrobiales bacterium]